MTADQPLELIVRDVRAAVTEVLSLDLCCANGEELPAWQPGSHVDVHLPSGLLRQDSLHGDQVDRSAYRIAILRIAVRRGELIHSSPL